MVDKNTKLINDELHYYMMALSDVDLARALCNWVGGDTPEPNDFVKVLHDALDKSYKALTEVVKEHRERFLNSPVREEFDIDSLLKVLDKENDNENKSN